MAIQKYLKRLKHNRILTRTIEYLAYGLVRLCFATYRIHVTVDPALKTPLNSNEGVFYGWHQNIVGNAAMFLKQNFAFHLIVSPSKDGQSVGAVSEMLGLKVIYGSAYKQTTSLVRQSLKVLQNEKQLFVIGDGSRGPAKKLQPGIRYLAKKSNLPIIFFDCQVQHKITFNKTWDKFQLPLPFTKIFITVTKQ